MSVENTSAVVGVGQQGQGLQKPKPNIFMQMFPLVIVLLFFYFFIIRPQSKRSKEQRSMIDSLKIGNKIITNFGMYGVVTKIESEKGVLQVEIAKNVRVLISASAVASVLTDVDVVVKEDSAS